MKVNARTVKVLRLLLFPFAVLYDAATRLRNHLYNIGYRHSISFDRPVIVVGNLRVGGTGKTPMVEYLVHLLKEQYHVATLSRGYGRRSRGFRIAQSADNAKTLGDEPMQYRLKFDKSITVCVGEDRALAIAELLGEKVETEVIILDDAFQHRAVQPTFNILLTEYSAPFFNDFVLPTGDLREARSGAQRADAIIVTKCPAQISNESRAYMVEGIRQYAPSKPVFFSTVHYQEPKPVCGALWFEPNKAVLITGIAHPAPFVEYVKNRYSIEKHYRFADHHNYTLQDVHSVVAFVKACGADTVLLTTEKDMVRLLPFQEHLEQIPLFYIPISMQFLESGSDFDRLVHSSIKS